MKFKKPGLLCVLCALCSLIGKAQVNQVESVPADTSINFRARQTDTASTFFTIKEIIVEGNRQTKRSTILRELSFYPGASYSLSELVKRFAEAKRQLMNTALFTEVVVALNSVAGYDASIKIEVKERWYIFPVPFIKTVDRSFGEWVREQNMSLDRVNYGVKVTHYNTTGRNDKLSFNFMNGYTKQFAITYRNLWLDKKQQWLIAGGFALGKNRQLDYITSGNKRLFYKDDQRFVHSFSRGFAEVSYRRAIKTKHTFGLSYTTESFPDTVLKINPSFSTDQLKRVKYPEAYYVLSHFNVDYIPYPTKGYIAELTVRQKGIDRQMNMFQLTAKTSGLWHVGSKNILNLRVSGSIKLPFRQPYINQQLLGFNDLFMQGYEYYVINGAAGGYSKLSFSRELVNTQFHIASKRIKKINTIPFRLYAKIYGNAGYVYDPQPGTNFLGNKMLYSGGIGVDLVTFYDFILRFEWSFNQLGQNDIYLHRKEYF
ncbi:MAG TPA: POTRA domain-containing protein [Chitinophagaceae bacterium]|nr:POTRA domain-containing protein [Chitinophagaceae bacterium]